MDTSINKPLKRFPVAAVFAFVYAFFDVIYVLLGVFLLRKKNDMIFCRAVAVFAFYKCITFSFDVFRHVTLYGIVMLLLYLIQNASLLFIALSHCSDDRIKVYFEKYIPLSKIMWFVPMAVEVLKEFIRIIYIIHLNYLNSSIFDVLYFYRFPRFIMFVCSVLFFAFIARWLVDPYYVPESSSNDANTSDVMHTEQGEAYCGMIKHILLLLFTFGIWTYIWTYRTTKFLNKAPGVEYYNPTTKLLLCMFIPFYHIYWLYKHGQRIDKFSKAKKLNNLDMAITCLIFGIFAPIVAYILMQDRINILCTDSVSEECTESVSTTSSVKVDDVADELKKYKELFDSGIITQEEFEAKKKQFLGI